MKTFYLIDFENVHNDGIANIESMTKEEHVHIFSTQNATNIRKEIFWLNGDIKSHLVPVGNQSLDMHLVSYLGHLLGVYGKECSYVIISKDKDYDNIVKFWKEEGYPNISQEEKLPGTASTQRQKTQTVSQTKSNVQTVNSKISAGMAYEFEGDDKRELDQFMQSELVAIGYYGESVDEICDVVIKHCNDERILNGIHNAIMNSFNNYSEVYKDVKSILEKFVHSKSKVAKRESQVRSFFGQHFKKKIYVDCKEEIIQIILKSETKQQVNNGLLKLYSDGTVVSHIYKTIKPLINGLPGK